MALYLGENKVSGRGRALDDYSLNEQVIGTWTKSDGTEVPLYRKLFYVQSPTVSTEGTNAYATYSTTGLNIDFGFIYQSWLVDGNMYVFTLPHTNSVNRMIKAYFDSTNKKIELAANGTTYSNKECIIELRYTKTTD